MRYIRDKVSPDVKIIRNQMAKFYKFMRKDDKSSLARLLYKYNKKVERDLSNYVANAILKG